MHIFSPIDLKFTKLKKKKKIFCSAHPLNIINFIWGKNINQEGGGQKMNFKFNIHPWGSSEKIEMTVNDMFKLYRREHS